MVSLLDINVLVALAWSNHEHHGWATRWFQQNEWRGWATCSLPQSGFVRVSSNKRAVPEAQSPGEAVALLRRIVSLPNHVFFSDNVSLVPWKFIDPKKLTGYRQVTDARLLGVALQHEARLATFDQGIANLIPGGFPADEAICLISGA